jgi:hypothetical protein
MSHNDPPQRVMSLAEEGDKNDDDDDDDFETFLRDIKVPFPDITSDHVAIDTLCSTSFQIPEYVDDFNVIVPTAELVVGTIPIENLEAREAELEAARIQQAQVQHEP